MRFYEDSIWLMTIGGILIGITTVIFKYVYKIKISDCNICGICNIHRDVEQEVDNGSNDEIPSPQNSRKIPNMI